MERESNQGSQPKTLRLPSPMNFPSTVECQSNQGSKYKTVGLQEKRGREEHNKEAHEGSNAPIRRRGTPQGKWPTASFKKGKGSIMD